MMLLLTLFSMLLSAIAFGREEPISPSHTTGNHSTGARTLLSGNFLRIDLAVFAVQSTTLQAVLDAINDASFVTDLANQLLKRGFDIPADRVSVSTPVLNRVGTDSSMLAAAVLAGLGVSYIVYLMFCGKATEQQDPKVSNQ